MEYFFLCWASCYERRKSVTKSWQQLRVEWINKYERVFVIMTVRECMLCKVKMERQRKNGDRRRTKLLFHGLKYICMAPIDSIEPKLRVCWQTMAFRLLCRTHGFDERIARRWASQWCTIYLYARVVFCCCCRCCYFLCVTDMSGLMRYNKISSEKFRSNWCIHHHHTVVIVIINIIIKHASFVSKLVSPQ